MARFIGGVEGARGPATRLGTVNSGITAYAQGWSIGGRISCEVVDENDEVVFSVSGGSNGQRSGGWIASARIIDGQIWIKTAGNMEWRKFE